MVTVEELLATESESKFGNADDIIHIDPVTRQLLIPASELILGVEGDEKAESKFFSMPKVVGNNIDVTQCSIRINYKNSNGDTGFYPVTDIAVNDTTVVFRWELSRTVTRYAGDTEFTICLCKSTDGIIVNEWHTAPTPGRVLEGIDVDLAVDEEGRPDILAETIAAADRASLAAAVAEDAAQSVDAPAIQAALDSKGDSLYMDEAAGLLYLTSNGEIVGEGIRVATQGGSNADLTYVVTLTNLLDSRYITVAENSPVVLEFNYSSVDDGGIDDGPGVGKILISNIVQHNFVVTQGSNTVDITSLLGVGTASVKVLVENSEGMTKTLSYSVTVASAYLNSNFDASVPYSDDINFTYTPTGLAEKTVHFELDGAEIGTAKVSASGRQQSYTIPKQNHGSHVLRVWFTCDISGASMTSNVLYFNIICITEGNTDPVIAVTSPPVTGVEQYSNIVKRYRVYSPTSLTAPITLEVNGEVVANLTVDRTEHTWTYRAEDAGEITQTIRCGTVAVSWTQNVTESSIKVEAETEALALYLTSYGRSNNEDNPGVWQHGNVSCDFQNFNFVSDGWKQDDDDITVLRVTGDARLNIPYKAFAYDFRTTGKTIEFELATRDVLNYDAVVISCFSGDRGFRITAQQLRLASEQSSLGTRYKEDEHIRVTFVAEKKSENRLLLCYINGIMSGAVQYPEDDDFSQAAPVGITVGSNECTTDLYNIRIYDNNLTRFQILDNWIADTQNSTERLARYERNDVYDVYGQIVISKLPRDLCYLVLQSEALPQFKGDKKTCSGYFVDLVHPERSFSFTGAEIDVQGTSSQYYYRKNYKIKFKGGFIVADGNTVEAYQMNSGSVPTDTFTMKADVASSEGAFNVILSMLYNQLCPYKTPAQVADGRVRQTIEGFPIVIFWENKDGTSFLGKYNFNNDKGTEEVFGFKHGDESWEILQNGTDRVGWHSADFSGDGWKTDFEARYPDKNTNITKLQELAAWLVSTDTAGATGNAIEPVTYGGVEYTTDTAEYRLAKFSIELSDHFIEEAVIFYYLYTEMFLSIDQREKNAFPTYLVDADRWIVLFYDADSSLGTDNKGNLAFDYYLEDIDYTEGGDPVYNGQNSVLWKNLRATRYNEIMAMYQDLRTRTDNSVSYETVIGMFENHQSKWPEAIFNEDMHTKCLVPLIESGDGLYLPMLQGKKEQWMKWWLYNRFRYLDSKYVTGTSMENRITIRAHQKANVQLTSYVNMYGHVYFNAAMVEHRMERNVPYDFEWPASGAEDPVIGINDADLLTSLGDLSPLMVELIDVSGAPHITFLKLGDGASDYANYSLNSITLGNNVLLRTLDVRNCPNLTTTPDVSGCTNIEEVYFEGSSIQGVKLPNGGVLKTLHLPGTVVNLTVVNQPQLTDFSIPSYSQITTLRLENAGVLDGMALGILNAIPENSRVRLLGVSFPECSAEEAMAICDRLDKMRGLDESGNTVDAAQVSGTIHITSLTGEELYRFQSRYPSIEVTYDELTLYTVRFWNGDTLLQTVNGLLYNAAAEYTGDTPTKSDVSNPEDYTFTHWDPEPIVTGDMDCYAQFEFTGSYARTLIQRTIRGDYVNDRVASVGASAFRGSRLITSVAFPNAKIIKNGAFYGCSSLAEVNIPEAITIEGNAFRDDTNISKLYLPKVTHLAGVSALNKLTLVDFSSIETLQYNVFQNCKGLVTVIIRNQTMCGMSGDAFNGCVHFKGTVDATYNPNGDKDGYIYVPKILVDSYKAATNWSNYADQIRAIEDYPDICGGDV